MMANEWLVITGSLSLVIALLEAWMLVILFTQPGSGLTKLIQNPQDLIKSHIDYLMMSQLLFVFYLLFSHYQRPAPSVILLFMCLGAIGNAGLFLVRAMYPSLKDEPTPAFRTSMGISCLMTTVGFLGGAWIVASSAIARL